MTKKVFKILPVLVILLILFNYKSILRGIFPTSYKDTVFKYSIKYNLDPYLVFSVIKVESKFDSFAESPKEARGLMQITPQTGEYIAELLNEKNYKNENLYDPETNIRYGCFYLSKLYNDFGGNIDCVLAAYNGGEGNVRKWLKTDESGQKYLDTERLPFAETRGYLKKVKRNYKVYNYLYTR
jgi:soluble lytic murein transglycosylase